MVEILGQEVMSRYLDERPSLADHALGFLNKGSDLAIDAESRVSRRVHTRECDVRLTPVPTA